MPTAHHTTPDWQQRLKEELARNKKQTFALGALVLVSLVVGVRMLKKKSGPASASAAPVIAVQAQPLPGVPSAAGAGVDTERDAYIRQISHDLTRDIFEFRPKLYPQVRPLAPDLAMPTGGPEGHPGLAVEELVHERAAKLTLQSTIASSFPTAVINEQILSLGDTVEGFRVVDIGQGWCEVEQAGVQVHLEIPPD